jgi:hypothetical protein
MNENYLRAIKETDLNFNAYYTTPIQTMTVTTMPPLGSFVNIKHRSRMNNMIVTCENPASVSVIPIIFIGNFTQVQSEATRDGTGAKRRRNRRPTKCKKGRYCKSKSTRRL